MVEERRQLPRPLPLGRHQRWQRGWRHSSLSPAMRPRTPRTMSSVSARLPSRGRSTSGPRVRS